MNLHTFAIAMLHFTYVLNHLPELWITIAWLMNVSFLRLSYSRFLQLSLCDIYQFRFVWAYSTIKKRINFEHSAYFHTFEWMNAPDQRSITRVRPLRWLANTLFAPPAFITLLLVARDVQTQYLATMSVTTSFSADLLSDLNRAHVAKGLSGFSALPKQ